jgi:hypothetical protein
VSRGGTDGVTQTPARLSQPARDRSPVNVAGKRLGPAKMQRTRRSSSRFRSLDTAGTWIVRATTAWPATKRAEGDRDEA